MVEIHIEAELAEREDVVKLGLAHGFSQTVEIAQSMTFQFALVHLGFIHQHQRMRWEL